MNVAVTGATGYSGEYITRRLLQAGHRVITLTNSPWRPNPHQVPAFPFHFDQPERLKDSLRGIEVLINTFWVRFNHRLFTHQQAVANTKILFQAAKDAGVRRVVHVSITNPDMNSHLSYFKGKAEVELALQALGIGHSILRPAVLFGMEDILINNIAWSLRHLPVYGVFGAGNYRLQPIYVDDFAAAAVREANESSARVINALGPETFTFRELVELVKRALGLRRAVISVPPALGYWAGRLLGLLVGDFVVTREEIQGLMANRLYVEAEPIGTTRLSTWVQQHRDTLGRHYASEMARRMRKNR